MLIWVLRKVVSQSLRYKQLGGLKVRLKPRLHEGQHGEEETNAGDGAHCALVQNSYCAVR